MPIRVYPFSLKRIGYSCPGCTGRSFASSPLDPHAVLKLKHGASPETIRQAYLEQAKALHPDTNPSPDAHARFQQLQEAYAALSNSTRTGGGAYSTSATSSTASGQPQYSSHNMNDPMGTGWHYDEFLKARAEWASRSAHSSPNQSTNAWDILRSRRGWVEGGLAHRTAYQLWRLLWGFWPVWLLLFATLGIKRQQSAESTVPPGVYHDSHGRAFLKDMRGFEHRVPKYDIEV